MAALSMAIADTLKTKRKPLIWLLLPWQIDRVPVGELPVRSPVPPPDANRQFSFFFVGYGKRRHRTVAWILPYTKAKITQPLYVNGHSL
jgi:hypothetical protein